jgi:2,5-furandicarboxylate decarboxylase 1
MTEIPKDLKSYLSLVQKEAPELWAKVDRPIDLRYEMTALITKLAAQYRYPIVLFEKVIGAGHPVVCNLFASRKAMALALDCTPAEMNEVYLSRLENPIAPRIVADGPVKEVVHRGDKADLGDLAVPTHHEDDAGPYVTGGVVIAKHHGSTTVNLGMYRFMVSSAREGGLWISPLHHGAELFRQAERRNEPLEMAIVIGHHPALAIASQNNEPFGTDDYALAGGLLDEPLLLVQAETLDFPVPAMAEIVIEGELLPGQRKDEAPFGEYTQYYGAKRKAPLFRVNAITYRRDYIFHDIIPINREILGLWVIPSKEANLYKKIKAVFPTVKEVCIPLNGSAYHAYVRIEKVRDGDGKNVLLTLLGNEPMIKHAVVVDDDVDIQNDDEVLWAVSTRVQADQDLFIIPQARGSILDPSSYGLGTLFSGEGMVTKVGIDATRPVGMDFSKKVQVPQEVWERLNLDDYLPE